MTTRFSLFAAACVLSLLILTPGPTRSVESDPPRKEPVYDLLLRGGTIVDGTGNPWYRGDVALRGDRIAAVGRAVSGKATREIDAKGFVIAPGFIDIHSHSDLLLLEDGNAQSKIYQGVTTEVLGEGLTPGPVTARSPKRPDARWTRLSDYFDAIQRGGVSVNVASYVGLDNVWQGVMGTSFTRPSEKQFTEMETLLESALKDGAFGLSSLLAQTPGMLATTEDLIRLCKVVHRHNGIFSSHIRHEGEDVHKAVKEAIEVGEKADVPVDIIHLKIAERKLWGRMNDLVALIDSARKRGVNVQANVYPYTRGSNNLSSIIPPWAHEGGVSAMLARLKDPKLRPRLKKEIETGLPGWYNHYTAVGGDWSRMLVSGKGRYEGLTMDRVIAARIKGANKEKPEPLDILFDLLVEEGGSVSTVYEHHTEKDMNLALSQPWCSIGSDGLAYATEGPLRRGVPHPRSFGTFPRVLGVYCEKRKLLTLEDAVRKMTSLNATKLGIADRGVLRSGNFADVTVFDPKKVIDRATYTEPFAYSEGVEYVVVNGVLVLDRGKHTKKRPGRVLRRPS